MTNQNEQEIETTNHAKFKMVALDLDGTLLNSQHKISKASVEYLRYLHKKGMIICIATGRSAFATAQVIQELDLEYSNSHAVTGFPLVCFNGARGLIVEKGSKSDAINDDDNDQNDETPYNSNPMIDGRLKIIHLFHNHVPMDLTLKTLEFAKSIGCVTNYYINHDIYAQPTVDWHYKATQKYTELTGVKYTFCTDDYKEAISQSLPSKLLILCSKENLEDVYQKTAEHLDEDAMIIKGSPPFFVEILRKDVCKGNGLENMCDSLGVSIDKCISFGDGNNDLEFIQKSGFGYAMKNAADVIKSIADGETEYSNNDDGVVRTLKELEQSGKLNFLH